MYNFGTMQDAVTRDNRGPLVAALSNSELDVAAAKVVEPLDSSALALASDLDSEVLKTNGTTRRAAKVIHALPSPPAAAVVTAAGAMDVRVARRHGGGAPPVAPVGAGLSARQACKTAKKTAGKMEKAKPTTPPTTARRTHGKRAQQGASRAGAVHPYPAEIESGNWEYKLQLATCSELRLGRLTSQLKWRLAEGGGEAVYVLGVEDDGTPIGIDRKQMSESLKKLRRMATMLACEVVNVRMKNGQEGQIAEVRIRRKRVDVVPDESEALFLGASGTGKTTLVGVLKTDETDDGQGLARLHILKHQHEMDLGLTSATSCHVIRYGSDGEAKLDFDDDQGVPSDIFTDVDGESARKMHGVTETVTLIDTAGHPRYFKTALYGLTAMHPDFAVIIIDAEALQAHGSGNYAGDEGGAAQRIRFTLDLLVMCKLLKVPFIVVVTKSDLFVGGSESQGAQVATLETLARELVAQVFEALSDQGASVPGLQVFVCSSTTKAGIVTLRRALGALRRNAGLGPWPQGAPVVCHRLENCASADACMYVRESFQTCDFDDSGVIVGGRLTSGVVAVGDTLLFGPDSRGGFVNVVVHSIRTAYGADLSVVAAGHTVTFALRLAKKRGAAEKSAEGGVDGAGNVADGGASDTCALDGPDLARIARRGACLCAPDRARHVDWGAKLRVLACLDLNSGAIALELDASKHHEFTLRSSTLKQRVLCSSLRADELNVQFQHRPEALPLQEPVILQRGATIVLAHFCIGTVKTT
ncbi:GTP-binding protein 1 [Hondaea fermentalgiana]|uniref:Elongation factor Tu, chloroplastic n=1 Tax=Hondaea fermentalgiana TaxID=2315210 RepID=A0A2R5GLX1_9STRA|nr:GTP-binding protein 1 [Hondaea fermentalgiana]|eukprot:GBG29281.1 GTP-binding protein 1 [Hondaea fermentalgiana]